MTTSPMIRKIAAFAVAGLLSIAGSASAAPMIDIGNIQLLADKDQQVVPIHVTGGGDVQGLNFVGVVEGGGPEMGGALGPKITFVDITGPGTLFNASNTGAQDPQNITPQLFIVSTTTATTPPTVNADDAVLAYVTFDTRGISGGPFTFDLSYAQNGQSTDFGGIPIDITPGTLTIVPEPGSIGLLALAGLMMMRRRR